MEFEPEEPEPDKLTIRMIEALNGEIDHEFVDGLYFHCGDFLEVLERDMTNCESEGDLTGESFYEELINRIRLIIMNRSYNENN